MDTKAKYEAIELEVIRFDVEDIITSSIVSGITSEPPSGGNEEEFLDE